MLMLTFRAWRFSAGWREKEKLQCVEMLALNSNAEAMEKLR